MFCALMKKLLAYLLTYLPTYVVFTYSLVYLPTPYSRVLLEKLIGSHLVNKFLAFYGTRRFITAFTSCETNRPSGPIGPDGLYVSQRTGSHSAGISCSIHELFCL